MSYSKNQFEVWYGEMTEKRFTIESERIGSTYSIHIFKGDEVIFEISNWGSLSNIHKKECEEFVDYLNSITEENEKLKSENQRLSEQKHIYKQDWKHVCIDKELLDSENEELKSRVDDLKELNKIYVDFLVNEGYELADVMGKGDVE